MTPAVRAVLFDLDGTLIDSAPDLAGAGNDMRAARGLPMLPLAHFRPMVGSGARGMLGRALQVQPDHPDFEALRDEFGAQRLVYGSWYARYAMGPMLFYLHHTNLTEAELALVCAGNLERILDA